MKLKEKFCILPYTCGGKPPHILEEVNKSPKTVKRYWVKSIRRKILAQYQEELSTIAALKTEFLVTVAFQSETKPLCVRDAVGILIPNKGSTK